MTPSRSSRARSIHRKKASAHPALSTSQIIGADSMAVIRVGPAGWSYPDWSGYVYPSRRTNGFHEAAYLAAFFDTIEINTSFYQPLLPDHAPQLTDPLAANPPFLLTPNF